MGPGCGSGGGQPFSCNPTPSLDGAHLTDAARSVLGVRMGTWGLWVGELCPTCFLGGACVPTSLPPEASFTHLWQPLQLSSLALAPWVHPLACCVWVEGPFRRSPEVRVLIRDCRGPASLLGLLPSRLCGCRLGLLCYSHGLLCVRYHGTSLA